MRAETFYLVNHSDGSQSVLVPGDTGWTDVKGVAHGVEELVDERAMSRLGVERCEVLGEAPDPLLDVARFSRRGATIEIWGERRDVEDIRATIHERALSRTPAKTPPNLFIKRIVEDLSTTEHPDDLKSLYREAQIFTSSEDKEPSLLYSEYVEVEVKEVHELCECVANMKTRVQHSFEYTCPNCRQVKRYAVPEKGSSVFCRGGDFSVFPRERTDHKEASL